MNKKIFIILLAASFLFFSAVQAQASEIYNPRLLPDSPFYFLKSWTESIGTFFTFRTESKVKRFLKLSERRLIEAIALDEKGKTELVEKTLQKYQNNFELAMENIEKKAHSENFIANLLDPLVGYAVRGFERLEGISLQNTGAIENIEKNLESLIAIDVEIQERVNVNDEKLPEIEIVDILEDDQEDSRVEKDIIREELKIIEDDDKEIVEAQKTTADQKTEKKKPEGISNKEIIKDAFLGKIRAVNCFYFEPGDVGGEMVRVDIYARKGEMKTIFHERGSNEYSTMKDSFLFQWEEGSTEGIKIPLEEGEELMLIDSSFEEDILDCLWLEEISIFGIPKEIKFILIDPSEIILRSVVSMSCSDTIFLTKDDYFLPTLVAPSDHVYYDIDLHVYDLEGRHVGMNYETGEYELQIPDARTVGNIGDGGFEWISVPGSIKNYKVFIDPLLARKWSEKTGRKIEISCDVRLILHTWEVGERIELGPINIDIDLNKPNLVEFDSLDF